MAAKITLPNFSANWPFQRNLHPNFESAAADSAKWVESFHLLSNKAQVAFNRCKFSLLASLVYPRVGPAHLRVACDLVNWFFAFDEASDALDGPAARELASRLIDILRDPLKHRPDMTNLEAMTASFWARSLAIASPSSARRIVRSLETYIKSMGDEAEDRVSGHMRSIEEYLALRRETAGIKPAMDFYLLTAELPEEVLSHPCIDSLTRSAVDLMIILNDVYSWNYERSQGLDNHNLVSVVIFEKNLDNQSAIDFVSEWYRGVAENFVKDMNNVPSFSKAIDQKLSEYIIGLGYAVVGYDAWAFESERYFGVAGPEIKQSRVVELIPKRTKCH